MDVPASQRVDVHSGTRTQYHSLLTPDEQCLVVGSKRCVSFYLGFIRWMYLHIRVDVRSGT
ncbi:unnamed protein product [Schistosoma margrebowiei]|uniref:Uncharacterized protein n=1 Tax=Schistosoma margrebowiei TaxID=48269 RepID=A0A183MR57_9TREM|nr:unnamed protein product [Schistosoma margrebowiei]